MQLLFRYNSSFLSYEFFPNSFFKFLRVKIGKSEQCEHEFTNLTDSGIYYTVFHADPYDVFRYSREWITAAPPTCTAYSDPLSIKIPNFRMLGWIGLKIGR